MNGSPVKLDEGGDGDGVWIGRYKFDFVSHGYLAFAGYGYVETGAAAGEEFFYHVVGFEADA